MEPSTDKEPEAVPEKKSSSRYVIFFVVLAIVGGGYGIIKYLHSRKHIKTDDAQVGALISPVIPHVSGYISLVYVSDNQHVNIGDTLLVLDDRDYKVKLDDARASLLSAKSSLTIAQAGIPVTQANINTSESNVTTIEAQMEAAEVNVWRARRDFERYENLIKDHSITQQQFEQALATKQSAERQMMVLEAQRESAAKQAAAVASQRSVNTGQVSAAKAMILKSEAMVDAAQLGMAYTIILAEVNGQVSKVNLQPGQYVQEGQALFSIVPQGAKWIVANFKETQLKKMKIGQKVLITVDAFPDAKLEGVVSSFSPATGAAQSLLPPDNASGNFVKVVQRLPVKIEFLHPEEERIEKLSAGLNVVVDVLIDSLIRK